MACAQASESTELAELEYNPACVDFSFRSAVTARLARLADFDDAKCAASYAKARTQLEMSHVSFSSLEMHNTGLGVIAPPASRPVHRIHE